MLARTLLVAVISIGCLAQQPGDRYAVLKSALGLSDSQLQQLEQRLPPGPEVRHMLLNSVQKARLAVIERVLHRGKLASEAIVLGLISEEHWPGATLCYYSILYYAYASEIGLSFPQARQFELLQHAAREPLHAQITEKENHRLALLNSGVSADSLTIARLSVDIAEQRKQAGETRPPRDLAKALLNDAQKAKIAAFEIELRAATEAIELGLIPAPLKSEVLCH